MIAFVSLVLLSPALLLIAILVIISSGRPVLFHQRRVGLHKHEFELLKFRSMVHSPTNGGPWATSKNDNRITPIGRILRRTSLDELPQIWNVLKGEMSIVGPRPDVPQQRQLYADAEWDLRTSVRPGLTGLAQATLRSAATPEQRKKLDLQYVRDRSITLDLWILWQTLRQVFFKGSY